MLDFKGVLMFGEVLRSEGLMNMFHMMDEDCLTRA